MHSGPHQFSQVYHVRDLGPNQLPPGLSCILVQIISSQVLSCIIQISWSLSDPARVILYLGFHHLFISSYVSYSYLTVFAGYHAC
jgi:hypothetical protein